MSTHSQVNSKPVPPYPALGAAPGYINILDRDRLKAYRKVWTAGRAMATVKNMLPDGFDPEADFAAYQLVKLHQDLEALSVINQNDTDYSERKMGMLARIRELEIQHAGHGDADRFARTAAAVCHGRKFFITEEGFFGVGPAATQIGDAVHVLLGADVPFLLRQGNMCGRYNLDGSWKLMGECYVQGLMIGEAVRAVGKPSEELDDVILR